MLCRVLIVVCLFVCPSLTHASDAPGITSLTNPNVRYTEPTEHFVRIERGDLSLIVVDNAAVNLPDLPDHRSGYNGIASLKHKQQPQNLFVPGIAGLNFEHIHDGSTARLTEKFEPRRCPMQLRKVDEFTVEIYQPPTSVNQLESCGRYQVLENGVVEYTFECIPRANDYTHDYIGLFWASYIRHPQDGSIWFYGRAAGSSNDPGLINGITPAHGVDSTHRPAGASLPAVDADFPLTLVNHPSSYEFTQPWYYGVSHGMAFVQMFRRQDQLWMAQSPSGGGNNQPAWDFQWFIPNPEVGRHYGFVMRAAYLPFTSAEQLEADIAPLRID